LQIREPKWYLPSCKYPLPQKVSHLKKKKAHQRKRPVGSNSAQLKPDAIRESTRQHPPLAKKPWEFPLEISFFWKEQKCSRKTGSNFLPPTSRGPPHKDKPPCPTLTPEQRFHYCTPKIRIWIWICTLRKGCMFKCWKAHLHPVVPGETLISSNGEIFCIRQTITLHCHTHRITVTPWPIKLTHKAETLELVDFQRSQDTRINSSSAISYEQRKVAFQETWALEQSDITHVWCEHLKHFTVFFNKVVSFCIYKEHYLSVLIVGQFKIRLTFKTKTR